MTEYKKIPLSSLYPDSKPPFTLYMHVGNDYLKFADRNLFIDSQMLFDLQHKHRQTLYIHESEERDYQLYMQDQMLELSKNISEPDKKAQALYSTATNIVDSLFENPTSPKHIQETKKLSSTMLENIMEDERAFQSLIKVSSFDYYTYTHCINVSVYALGIAHHCHLPPDEIRLLGEGAILHDLGKARIAPEIINKEGPLSDAEFEAIKQHPVFGIELLKQSGEKESGILEIIVHHHEKLDGSGYPHGIKGDAISLPAQIAAVADIFDALTTRRSYKPALSSFQAFKLMKTKMQHHINQDILNTFIKTMGS